MAHHDEPLLPHALGLAEAARRIRAGSLTAADLTRACLTRISRLEPRVQAWQHLEARRALEQAEERDAALAAGNAPGLLHGVPIGVKDIIDVAGMPTTMGSPVFRDHVARQSAAAVLRLEAAGVVIPGKTVTTEFAYYAPNRTRNPWNPGHTPGGSSMGSAAAVAACMVPAAIGTQTNGSVIRPAAYCGVVGFKPSVGAIPVEGMLALAPTFDTAGVFARSVEDVALLASALVDPGRRRPSRPPARSAPPRIAAVRSPVWDLADEGQRAAFAASLDALRRAGARVDELDLGGAFLQGHDAHRTIMAYEAALNLGDVQRRYRDALSARLNALLDEGRAAGESRYRSALCVRDAARREFAAAMSRFDAAVTPPATGEAPATLAETGNPAFCTLWTLLGVPAVTLPAGSGPSGLPLGLQIVGQVDADDILLSVASWCEQALPRPSRLP
ncbi:MAG: amidase [Burkholderiales bacterium]|nr:amidase [Burkholderiales bacterium]